MSHHSGGVARRPRDARDRSLLEPVARDYLAGDVGDFIAPPCMIDDLRHGAA
jgi:hypothetical protein